MDLSKFKPYALSSGVPTLTIGKSGLAFSKTAVIRLGKSEYAQLLIDSDDKVIAVQAVTEDNDNAVAFFKSGRKNILVRWNYQDLIDRIIQMMNWNVESHTYKVKGTFYPEDKLLTFDLKNAEILK